MTIGQLSKRSGVGIEAIRFYEKEGILPRAERTDGGYRTYDEDTVKRLHFIGRAQKLGFSLKEIAQLFALRLTPKSNCGGVKKRAIAKLAEIDVKIADLERMRETLRELTKACDEENPIAKCPILNSFDR